MTAIAPTRRMTQEEETRYKSAVSESVAQKMGGSANFINLRQYDTKDFRLNGPIWLAATFPALGADGIYIFPFDAEIINIGLYLEASGSSGTTELDIKKSSDNGATWTSIFSTTAKVLHGASAFRNSLAYVITDDMTASPAYQTWAPATPPTNFTLPVLSGGAPFSVNKGDAIRLDMISAATGAENAQLIVYHRPR